MACLYLSLGSNLGARETMLTQAMAAIEKSIGPIVARSAFYDTPAWGFTSEHRFLNACLAVETSLDAKECLWQSQEIERELGRSRKSVHGEYHDRCIDIDLLFYDQELIDDDDLKIPHPLLHLRRFVLEPLVEIAPDLYHPIVEKTCKEILNSLI